MDFVATTTRGAEEVLVDELRELGLDPTAGRGAVTFSGPLEHGYRACLWSRVASRVLLTLKRFDVHSDRDLYTAVRSVAWQRHLGPDQTLAVDYVGGSDVIRNSRYGALKVKDAVCDRLRDETGRRPDVELHRPDLRLNVHQRGDHATLAIDLSGEALHLRGGRTAGVAPLRETLAAACLRLAGWKGDRPFADPFAGSGTLVIEAAEMALGVAPGLRRQRWGFSGWKQHDQQTWNRLRDEAKEVRTSELPPMLVSELDRNVLDHARRNLAARGLLDRVTTLSADARELAPRSEPGMMVCNPPYGERLGEVEDLAPAYRDLGDNLRRQWLGWDCWILTVLPLAKRLGLRSERRIPIHNGPIDCRLVHVPIAEQAPTGARPRR